MVRPNDQTIELLDFVRPRRTFEAIVDLLKQRIFSGHYRIGDRLPAERELAEMLGVGRPAVREAYRALELVGIVEIKKGKEGGAFIMTPNHRPVTHALGDLIRLRQVSIDDLRQARLILEKDVAELAVERVLPADLNALRAMVDTAVAVTEAGRLAMSENIGFHLRLAEISGNPILVMVLSSIMDLLTLVIRVVTPDAQFSRQIAEDHYAIVDALATRDLGRLWPVMERHIRASNDYLAKLAAEAGLYAATPEELERKAMRAG